MFLETKGVCWINSWQKFAVNLYTMTECVFGEIWSVLERLWHTKSLKKWYFVMRMLKRHWVVAEVPTLDKQPVLATILRAGIPFHQGFLNYFDNADNAFVAGFRKYHKDNTFEIKIDYVTSPDLTGRELIIADPMLATGGSFELAYKSLAQFGTPSHIHIASIIASKEGIAYMNKIMPSSRCTVWSAAVDDELTVKSYIVPGLGDAGDLAYGSKVAEKDD